MGFHACHGAVAPLDTEHADYHADSCVVVFEYRALLNMRFEAGTDGMRAGFFGSQIVDTFKFFFYRFSFGVPGGIRMFKRECLGKHARTHEAVADLVDHERHSRLARPREHEVAAMPKDGRH